MATVGKHVSVWVESTQIDGLLPSDALPELPLIDNAAIATHDIKQGDALYVHGKCLANSSHDILEGHRFATEHVAIGGELRSWGIPFGIALKAIAPGDYLCNIKVSMTLRPTMNSPLREWWAELPGRAFAAGSPA